MARRLTRREWTMLGLVAALGLIALWIRDPEFRLGGGPAKQADERNDLGDAPVIHLTKLEPTAETYDARARNLFEYFTPPPPKRPEPKRTKAPPRRTPKPQPPKPKTQTQSTAPKIPARPQPPRISFEYLGYLGPKDDRLAVFEEGEEIFLARAGEVVRDQFRVVEFQYEKLIMGFTDERFKEETAELKKKPGKKRR